MLYKNLSIKNTFIASLVVIPLGLLATSASYSQFPDGPQHKHIMERKLDTAQNVMAGIARADFDEIEKNAQSLHLLSREAGWNVLATPTYMRMSEDFRATVNQLEKAAEKKNLDAVGLAYVKLSISCIECHRYARNEMPRIGLRNLPAKDGPVIANASPVIAEGK